MQNRILLIDDDELILNSLKSLLSNENFIVQALDSSEGIDDIILLFRPHLIILDIKLPGADGREICDQLKSRQETSHIPIILLTALSYEEIARVECNADATIGKPFDGNNLISTIRQMLVDI